MNLNDPAELAQLLRAMLLTAEKPLSLERLQALFDEGECLPMALLQEALTVLARSCEDDVLELKEVASGYRLQVAERFAPWIARVKEERPQRYSRALLETLAIIAYKQPVTRGEIEDIRGVAVNSQIIRTLQERDWIRIVGHRDVPGRPALLATTKAFLDYFGLKGLDELPPLAVVRELEVDESEDLEELEQEAAAELETFAQKGAFVSEDETGEVSFRTLLAELDDMEQGIRIDFDDWPEVETIRSGEQAAVEDGESEPIGEGRPDDSGGGSHGLH